MQKKILKIIALILFWNSLMIYKNFPFTASETMREYYLQTCYIQVVSRVTERLKT